MDRRNLDPEFRARIQNIIDTYSTISKEIGKAEKQMQESTDNISSLKTQLAELKATETIVLQEFEAKYGHKITPNEIIEILYQD